MDQLTRLSRREFIKLMTLAPAALVFSETIMPSPLAATSPNIVVMVCDAMSADNLSLYGYPRRTTPNFERLAQRSIVYHSHYSAGSFTTPGTASLLTGLYPWTHRALSFNGQVAPAFAGRNIFALLGNSYDRVGFGQNLLAEFLLSEFRSSLDVHMSPASFSVREQLLGTLFKNDTPASYYAFDDFFFRPSDIPRSLIFGMLEQALFGFRLESISTVGYSNGIPRTNNKIYYRLEDIFRGLASQVQLFRRPFFAYFHLWSPHAPYLPSKEFENAFRNDHWSPPTKPKHRLGQQLTFAQMQLQRQKYDAYVANVDSEFGKFLDELEASGELDRTCFILTSDHGEMFERGVVGHETPLLYDPILHVPLVISMPGQRDRKDIYSQTNSVDVLPTLLKIGGRDIPAWAEGQLLPALGGVEDNSRATFSLDAKKGSSFGRLSIASVAMRKEGYKLIYYKGYTKSDWFELYNLEKDPEEMVDLFDQETSVANTMKNELLTAFDQHSGPLTS